MSTPKEKNSIWTYLLLLPIVSAILLTIGGIAALIGIACLAAWFLLFRGSQTAFNSGDGNAWWQYVPLISKQSPGSGVSQPGPVLPPQHTQPVQSAPPVQAVQTVQPVQPVQPVQTVDRNMLWKENAPAFNKQRLTATLESLKWSSGDVHTLAYEAGDSLQYGLAFRSRYGNILPHSQRIESIQMSEIAADIKGCLPQGAVCRAWPLYELSKGINMDGLLIVPDQDTPLGLYLIIAGDNTKSRFTLFSMFVPVCTGKADWVFRIYQPSMEELRKESDLADLILKTAEQTIR